MSNNTEFTSEQQDTISKILDLVTPSPLDKRFADAIENQLVSMRQIPGGDVDTVISILETIKLFGAETGILTLSNMVRELERAYPDGSNPLIDLYSHVFENTVKMTVSGDPIPEPRIFSQEEIDQAFARAGRAIAAAELPASEPAGFGTHL